MEPLGLLYSLGAILCWGTALVFIKVKKVKNADIPPLMMTSFYSLGYVLTGVAVSIVLYAIGKPVHITWYGIGGGLVWGIGKSLTILAITSQIGLAMGQSIQCCVNIVTGFIAGICLGEEVSWLQYLAVLIIGVGISLVAAPGMQCTKSLLSQWKLLVNEDTARGVEESRAKGNGDEGFGMLIGASLATASGMCMGLQGLPYKLASDHNSLSYAVSQALGQFVIIVAISAGARFVHPVRLSGSSCLIGTISGLLGGGLLFAAALCNTFAIAQIGLVGSCLSQLNMVVAGLWGICLFREITDYRLILLFFAGTLLALLGAFLLVH